MSPNNFHNILRAKNLYLDINKKLGFEKKYEYINNSINWGDILKPNTSFNIKKKK